MKKSQTGLYLVLGVIVLIFGIYTIMRGSRRAAAPPTSTPTTTTTPPETPPPPSRSSITIPIANITNIKPIEVTAQTWVDIFFTVPARACTLTGHVEGISGGKKDFEGFVMDNEDYRNWSSGQPARGTASGRVVVWDPNVTLQGLDTFHLVVSNIFSVTTPKMVGVRARVNCP